MTTHHYAYRIEHVATGRYYIGIRSTTKRVGADGYYGSGVLIRRMVAKYGKSAFKREMLEIFATRKEASDYEKDVVTLELLADPDCLNLRPGGDAMDEEMRAQISAAKIGVGKSRVTKRRMSVAQKGRTFSQETRLKMSASAKKSCASPERRHQLSAQASAYLLALSKSDRIRRASRAALARWHRR